MKTLTEFPTLTLKNAAKTKAELVTAGKTAEELPQAMGEALKLEGDKLTFLLNALDAASAKPNDLKRVVVFSLAEGEKAPSQAKQVGEQWYLVEYYPSLHPRTASHGRDRDEGRGGRGGRDGKGRGKDRGGRGGRDGKGRGGPGAPGGSGRPSRGDRQAAPGERNMSAEGRGERKPRAPRVPQPPQGSTGPLPTPRPLETVKTDSEKT